MRASEAFLCGVLRLFVLMGAVIALGACGGGAVGEPAEGAADGEMTQPAIAVRGGDAGQGGPVGAVAPEELEIVELLPFDAIPAIDAPRYWSREDADEVYAEDEPVIGLEIQGEARAYSLPFLSRHEIVNDTVGGRAISVTW